MICFALRDPIKKRRKKTARARRFFLISVLVLNPVFDAASFLPPLLPPPPPLSSKLTTTALACASHPPRPTPRRRPSRKKTRAPSSRGVQGVAEGRRQNSGQGACLFFGGFSCPFLMFLQIGMHARNEAKVWNRASLSLEIQSIVADVHTVRNSFLAWRPPRNGRRASLSLSGC